MPYPPHIEVAHFPEPPAVVAAVQACPQEAEKPALTALWLTPNAHDARRDPYAADHDALDGGAGARYVMVPNTNTHLLWTIANPQFVATTKIEVLRRSLAAALPLFTRTITWNDGACPADGDIQFPVALEATAEGAMDGAAGVVDTVNAGMAASFPTHHLNIEWAPYKLRVTITDNRGYAVARGVAWIYLDVVAHSIVLGYGDREYVAAGHRLVTRDPDRIPAGDEVVKLLLPGNLFSDATHQWHEQNAQGVGNANDYPYERWRTAWGDGPQIPVVATIRVTRHDGTPAESDVATGGAGVLWDFEDAKAPEAHVTALIAAALNDNETAHGVGAGRNCHTNAGGLRGAAARVLPTQVANPDAFPFTVTNAVNRAGASVTTIGSAGATLGGTGVIFRPSRMGGDAYRLRLRWRYDAGRATGTTLLDVVDDVAPTVVIRTGIFKIWRALDLRRYARRGEGDDRLAASLAALRAVYAPAYIHLIEREEPAAVVMADYCDRIMTAAGAGSAVLREAVKNDDGWRAGAYAAHFNSYEHVVGRLGQNAVATLTAYFSAHGPEERQRKGADIQPEQLPTFYAAAVKGWTQHLIDTVLPQLIADAAGVNILDFNGVWVLDIHNAAAQTSTVQSLQGFASMIPGMNTAACFTNFLTDENYVTLSELTESVQTFVLTAAHELGHTLYLCHAPGGGVQRQGTGIEVAYHDAGMTNCLMGYDETAASFCAVCLLRLRGWQRAALTHTDLARPSDTQVFLPNEVAHHDARDKIAISIRDFATQAGTAGQAVVTCSSTTGRIVRNAVVPANGLLTIRIRQTGDVRASLRLTSGLEVLNVERLLQNNDVAWQVAMVLNKPVVQFGAVALRTVTLAVVAGANFEVELKLNESGVVTATDAQHAGIEFEEEMFALVPEPAATVQSTRLPITFVATAPVRITATVAGTEVAVNIP